jgi:hypothetical protein
VLLPVQVARSALIRNQNQVAALASTKPCQRIFAGIPGPRRSSPFLRAGLDRSCVTRVCEVQQDDVWSKLLFCPDSDSLFHDSESKSSVDAVKARPRTARMCSSSSTPKNQMGRDIRNCLLITRTAVAAVGTTYQRAEILPQQKGLPTRQIHRAHLFHSEMIESLPISGIAVYPLNASVRSSSARNERRT